VTRSSRIAIGWYAHLRALTAGVKRTAPVYVVASTSLRDPTASVPPLRSCSIAQHDG